MSRGYNARHKAKRQQARAAAETPRPKRTRRPRRPAALVPGLVIACVLAATAALGLGFGDDKSQGRVDQEVDALLAGVPQNGSTLGSPRAPITVVIYADLECPTVKLFVENYLPSLMANWVRPGVVKLEYHSLQTDTVNERTFFRQEIAAQAAGRQDKMWNFLLTFVHEQGEAFTGYANDEFLTDIASRVPGLKWARWRRDRADALLSRRVALDIYSAHASEFRYTPSFSLRFANAMVNRGAGVKASAAVRTEFKDFLIKEVGLLRQEASEDVPGLEVARAKSNFQREK